MAVLRKENLFSDMDGTLLSDDKKVSQENLAAIRRFVKAGGRFSVATGRSEVIAAPFLFDIPLNLPAIVYKMCIRDSLRSVCRIISTFRARLSAAGRNLT